jgi:MSHA pilin protein MshC
MHSSFFYHLSSQHKILHKTQGFTLVELILVIVLLSIISVIALPRFFDRNHFDERVFFDDTLNAIRYAQKLAVATGCQTRIVITNNSFALLREDNCDGTTPSFNNNLSVVNPTTGNTAYTGSQSGVSLTASQTETTFDSLGRMTPTTSSVDNIISVGSKQITIKAATGFSYDSTT